MDITLGFSSVTAVEKFQGKLHHRERYKYAGREKFTIFDRNRRLSQKRYTR